MLQELILVDKNSIIVQKWVQTALINIFLARKNKLKMLKTLIFLWLPFFLHAKSNH